MARTASKSSSQTLSLVSIAGLRRLTVEQYHQMHDAGILMEGERVELLDGYVVEKTMRNPLHEGVIRRLTTRLPKYVPTGWLVQIQDAITLPSDSEPEPDAAVVRGDETSYDTRHPGPTDVGLVIEVADSSLRFDRVEKGRLYARDSIPVYWVLNVADRAVEVYTDPDPAADPPAYRTRTDYPAGRDVPLVLDGTTATVLPVADLFPQ